jgi:Helix-turn-helix domain
VSAAVSRYIREALEDRQDLSATARHLLEVLGHVAGADGMSWWSVGELARRMGLADRRSVQRARRELVEAGLIVFTESRGRGRTNLYALPKTWRQRPLFGPENVALEAENGASDAVKGGAGAARSIHRRVHEDARTWCDATCPQCDGTGFVSYVHPILGGIGTAHPCPNRQP